METSMEEFIFEFIDQCKLLFFPERWNNTFLDYSKNEVFALLFVYRRGHANMTEIADYLGVPLNTATGIVSRLEKRGVIKRERDVVDKRVVTIAICREGKDFLNRQMEMIGHYYSLLMGVLTEEEKLLLIRISGKFLEIAGKDLSDADPFRDKKKVKKITIE
jgi:DNA-binding MarR family transcriptional regulator